MANNEDIYIEDRIAILEKQMEFILDNNFEDRITVLEDRVSTLEDIIETDGEKLDRLSERVEQKPQVQQTTDEFVKVVRCNDCKWWYGMVCDKHGYLTNADDYCSRGEKR